MLRSNNNERRWQWLVGAYGFYKKIDMHAPVTILDEGINSLVLGNMPAEIKNLPAGRLGRFCGKEQRLLCFLDVFARNAQEEERLRVGRAFIKDTDGFVLIIVEGCRGITCAAAFIIK